MTEVRHIHRKNRPPPEDVSINVLVEAKKEYTDQLVNHLYQPIYEGIQSIWTSVRMNVENEIARAKKQEEEAAENVQPNIIPTVVASTSASVRTNALKEFQEKLRLIPKWSEEIISKEYDRIIDISDCDWYDDLITAVFISHVKVLSSVRMHGSEANINLEVPSSKNFIHKCYIECARKFYENPYLFDDRESKVSYIDIQRNLRESYDIIKMCIVTTIQKLLPTQTILKQYFTQIDESSDAESEGDGDGEKYGNNDEDEGYRSDKSITKDTSEYKKSKIKKLVKKELESYFKHSKKKKDDDSSSSSSSSSSSDSEDEKEKEEKKSHGSRKSRRSHYSEKALRSKDLELLEKISSKPFINENSSDKRPNLDTVGSKYGDYREKEYTSDSGHEIKKITIPISKKLEGKLAITGELEPPAPPSNPLIENDRSKNRFYSDDEDEDEDEDERYRDHDRDRSDDYD